MKKLTEGHKMFISVMVIFVVYALIFILFEDYDRHVLMPFNEASDWHLLLFSIVVMIGLAYLLYHYGDGTTDGTGKRRMSSIEVRFMFDERIKKMNEEFNKSKEFIKKAAERFMFQGVNPDASKAEYIYHGDPDYGVFVSRNQYMRHIEKKNWDYMQTCVHIGPFVVRPHARYANKEIRNEEHRHTVVINYPRFVQDLLYISSRYSYAFTPNK